MLLTSFCAQCFAFANILLTNSQLLTREPELRLGSGPGDAQEIMSHAFFRNVNWDDIYHKRVPTPYQPQITSATDTSNFDSEFTSVTPVLTPVQSGMKLFSAPPLSLLPVLAIHRRAFFFIYTT